MENIKKSNVLKRENHIKFRQLNKSKGYEASYQQSNSQSCAHFSTIDTKVQQSREDKENGRINNKTKISTILCQE